MAMKMRQSLAQFEQAFTYETELGQQHAEQLKRATAARSRKRWHARQRKRGTMRFYVLTASLIVTAVLVTAGMLGALYLLLV
jgi:hypothetical protein